MVEPVVVSRDQHTLSRRDIDPDALKVLYRLHHAKYLAYLVGGSVRDLLLARRPKDFDVGTDAHPYQIKKLFRNCWIIGRRFRLAHVKFGQKTIEVATFRRGVVPGTEGEPPLSHDELHAEIRAGEPRPRAHAAPLAAGRDHLIHRDNTFGTPEEDAFRRDFTINALFYDVATFSIIDYVGGLADLKSGLIRCIGDPDVRFREDPVRMLRAIVLGARLGFEIDRPTYESVRRHRAQIARSAPARLMEEYYKILRSGAATSALRRLGEVGLLEHITPEIASPLPSRLARSLEALDAYRVRFDTAPDTLTNPVLLGSILVPLGLLHRRPRGRDEGGIGAGARAAQMLGMLQLSRRDLDHLAQIAGLQRRLLEVEASPRAKASLIRRHVFRNALTWLEIHGGAPAAVAHWHALLGSSGEERDSDLESDLAPRRRRRRRRRRGPRTPA